MTSLVRLTLAFTASALLVVAGGARAQTFDAGPYIGFSAGAILLDDADGSIAGVDAGIDYAPGYDIAGQLGYRFSMLRAELELEYADIDIDNLEAAGASVDADGKLEILRGTAGLYFDFTLLPLFTPYAGGGVGAAHIDDETFEVGGVEVDLEGGTYFTAHGEAGLGIEIPVLPLTLVPAYRFIWIDNGEDNLEDTKAHVLKLGARLQF